MDTEQLVLQLGIAGALIYFGSKIAKLLIEKWAKGDEARTKVIADGFTGMTTSMSSLAGSINAHATTDLQSHTQMTAAIAELRGKVDEAINWQERTPIGGVPAPPPVLPQQHPIVSIAESRVPSRSTPAAGVRAPRPGTHHDKER